MVTAHKKGTIWVGFQGKILNILLHRTGTSQASQLIGQCRRAYFSCWMNKQHQSTVCVANLVGKTHWFLFLFSFFQTWKLKKKPTCEEGRKQRAKYSIFWVKIEVEWVKNDNLLCKGLFQHSPQQRAVCVCVFLFSSFFIAPSSVLRAQRSVALALQPLIFQKLRAACLMRAYPSADILSPDRPLTAPGEQATPGIRPHTRANAVKLSGRSKPLSPD